MADEFQESDVVFSDHHHTAAGNNFHLFNESDRVAFNRNTSNKKRNKRSISSSVPVNIPSNVYRWSDSGDSEEEFDGGDGVVPPHVLMGRRIEGKMAYSVCTGNGRTLKGRDLSQVRNSILRLTGFLEG